VLYRESLMGHSIDPSFVRDVRGFVRTAATSS
jgi:hypothetical protein